MTKYYAGPWAWNSSETNPHYAAPAGSSALIDLRTMAAQSAANHANGVGNGFFCTPDDVTLPSEYDLLGQGYITEVATNNAVKSAWQTLYGVVPQGDKLIDYLSYTLGDGSDPDGDTAPKPLMPGSAPSNEVQIVLSGHSVVYRRQMNIRSGPSNHAKAIRDRLQKDLQDITDSGDDILWRKCLGFAKRKFGQAWDDPVEDWILTPKLKAKGKSKNKDGSIGKSRAIEPATTYTESWPTDGAITSSQDRTWTYIMGSSLSVVGGVLRQPTGTEENHARMNSALSSSDVYSSSVLKSYSEEVYYGTIARKDSNDATVTFYYDLIQRYSGSLYSYLYKYVAGTSTALATPGGYSSSINDVMKLETDGSSIKAYQNATERASATDTAISSGTYCGVWHKSRSTTSYMDTDDWECGDLGGGGAARPDLGLLLGVS